MSIHINSNVKSFCCSSPLSKDSFFHKSYGISCLSVFCSLFKCWIICFITIYVCNNCTNFFNRVRYLFFIFRNVLLIIHKYIFFYKFCFILNILFLSFNIFFFLFIFFRLFFCRFNGFFCIFNPPYAICNVIFANIAQVVNRIFCTQCCTYTFRCRLFFFCKCRTRKHCNCHTQCHQIRKHALFHAFFLLLFKNIKFI